MSALYIAGRFTRREELAGYADRLRQAGHEITSRWLSGHHDIPPSLPEEVRRDLKRQYACEDLADVFEADILVAFTEPPGVPNDSRGGRHVEFGVALAAGARLVLIGPRENIFHWLKNVEQYDDFEAYLQALSEETPS